MRLLTLLIALPAAAAPVDFVHDVRPILDRHCIECHGEKKQKSGLRLDVKAAAFKGGDGEGPAIVAGNARESPLIRFVTSADPEQRMPPKGDRLPPAQIATLTRWIDEGAVWPDGVDRVKFADPREHWSFKPLAVPPGRHSIDTFIAAKLREHGLTRSPPAARATWLRRVTLDLTGLPPTPAEIEGKHETDEQVVDRLLASPRYGERWAQHWLDVVRYADTHGFEVNTERPNAWPYRDYVIRAINADTPYDLFIKEQIAGDALGQDAATGFLVTASVLLPGQIGKDEPSKRLARQDAIDEIVVNISQTFLGLSVGCARCHDHKFDPISAKDYYSMQAFVAGVAYGDRDVHTPAADAKRAEAKRVRAEIADLDRQLARFVPLARTGATRPAVDARMNTDRFAPVKAKRLRFTIRATNSLEPCLDELEVFDTAGANIALAQAGTVPSSSGDIIVADRHELRLINDGHYGNSHSWMSNEKGAGWVALEFPQEYEIERVAWGRDREGQFKDRLATSYVIEIADASGEWRTVADSSDRAAAKAGDTKPTAFSTKGLPPTEAKAAAQLLAAKKSAEQKLAAAEEGTKAFAGTFRTPEKIRLLARGDPEQPKEEVPPAVLGVLGELTLPNESDDPQRRRALADWIADAKNPLTARVMVNRIWQGHFGVGLVETASDFGRSGEKPTHPELLDWLAAEFIRSGWSTKHLHRLIVLSAAYRQSARHNAASAERDAEARLLWRFPSRRLDAETIRDAMLAVSGTLNEKMYGRGFDLFDKRGGLTGFKPVESFSGDGLRRMIYAHKVRREREAVFGAFDCPDAGQSTARRRESTTPIQALNLFNSRFTLAQAEAFAARVQREAGADAPRQIRRAYQLALGREPDTTEVADALPAVQSHGLAPLCRAIFNSNEFLLP